MRYENLRALQKHLETAAPQFSPLYCIFSKEDFECQEAVEVLLRALFAKSWSARDGFDSARRGSSG